MAEIQRSKTVSFWCDQIAIYEREFKKWEGRSKKIVKRYKDERNDAENAKARFNVLWSNVQTLAPALYAKAPIPNVDRRYESDDENGTTTARVIERAVTYFVETELFDSIMQQCVLDRLLPGRGVAWVRYVPNFQDKAIEGGEEAKEQGFQLTDDKLIGEGDTEDEDKEPEQELYSEDVVIDYVHWQDFGHTWARTWEENRGVWRKVYMTRQEMIDRQFKNAEKIPLDYSEKKNADDGGMNEMGAKKATIYEIWDKTAKKALWVHKSMEDVLDEQDDPLGLEGFFPCPKPLYATLANDNLIPTPDYIQYQDQAKELDDLTGRITSISKALKVIGVYDKSAEGLSRLLSEGLENTMVPVEQWAMFAEKGGMTGVVDWFPLEQVATTLLTLYEARDKVKADLYEITGISDIIRGANDPSETATAANIKGQYATLRLNNQQKDVSRFARDLVRIMAEIICKHFSIETIKKISGMHLLEAAQKQQLMIQSQPKQGPDGQPVPPPPVPDEIQELLDQPTWEEVEQIMRDDTLRCFRISIETDSTIKQDQEAEKQSRIELLTAVGGYLQQAVLLPPQLMPLAAELLMFGVRGFKVARDIETTFDVALKKIKQAAEQPAPPNPEMEKQKMDFENNQAKNKLAADELVQRGREHDASMGLEVKKLQAEVIKAQLEAKQNVHPDVAATDPQMNPGGVAPIQQSMSQLSQMITQGFQQIAQQQAHSAAMILQAISQPRHTKVVRGPDGRIQEGVSTTMPQTVQ